MQKTANVDTVGRLCRFSSKKVAQPDYYLRNIPLNSGYGTNGGQGELADTEEAGVEGSGRHSSPQIPFWDSFQQRTAPLNAAT